MARKSDFTGRNIPSLSTRKSAPVTTNFAKGIYTYKPNDTMDSTEIRLAQDARFDRVGEYGTRLGYKRKGVPIGRNMYKDNRTAADADYLKPSQVKPATFTAPANATICSVIVDARKVQNQGSFVVIRVNMYVNNRLVAQSCFNDPAWQTASSHEVYFNNAPTVRTGDTVKVTVDMQTGDEDDVEVSTNGSSNDLRIRVYECTTGHIDNIFEFTVNNDVIYLFTFAHDISGTTRLDLCWQTGGTITTIRTLPAGAKKVRFSQNLNTVRYADGVEGPRLLTPSISGGVVTTWYDTAITVEDLQTGTALNVKASNIMNGTADNLVYFDPDVNTKAYWTYPYGYTYAKSPAFSTTATINGNPGTTLSISSSTITPSGIAVGDWITGQGTATAEVTSISGTTVNLRIVDTTPQSISSYDKFSVDFFQNFPAIKTGDPLTAMFNLGGVLYFMTRRNKYQMYAQSADSWTQSASNAQNGTFSQESIVCDLNYAYFASDNGIYVFDGSSEASLTEGSIQNVYDAITDKQNIVMELYQNRLYVFYPSASGLPNDSCLVYNINLRVWESFDSNAFVSAACARRNSSGNFVCGHSKMGLIMYAEKRNGTSADYADYGAAINFNLETSYQHFGAPSQLKRISKWRPQFATADKPYTVECGYALDYSDQVQYAFSIDLLRQAPTYVGRNMQGGFTNTLTQTHNGIAYSNNADGTFTVSSGTVSGGTSLSMWGSTAMANGRLIWMAPGTYTLSGGIGDIALQAVKPDGGVIATTSTATGKVTFTLMGRTQVFVRVSIANGKTVPATTVYAQLEAGPYATSYIPYSVWDNPSDYGVPAIPTRHTTLAKVNGKFYRCQIRYQHIAAFEPVIFRSHTLTVETQRIR